MQLLIKAGFHDRKACPVAVQLPEGAENGAYALVNKAGDKLPAYAQNGVLRFVLPILNAGEELTLTAEKAPESEKPACAARVEGGFVYITVAGRPYTQYYFGPDTPKPYLGPLYGPWGEQITRLNFQEKEHVHHRSLWFSHGSVNGVDTWNEPKDRHGYILTQGIEDIVCSDAYTSFTVRNTWTDHSKKPLADDVTTLRFYNTPASACLFDAELTLTAAYGDVVLGVTKEAGPVAVRMNYNLTVPNTGRFETGAGGVNEKEIWMSRAPWCDYYGVEDGHTVGIAILDNPANTRYPAWWHSRDYGLMAPNYYYKGGDQTIPAGSSETFRFRFITHAGSTAQAGIGAKFSDYAAPPEAELTE